MRDVALIMAGAVVAAQVINVVISVSVHARVASHHLRCMFYAAVTCLAVSAVGGVVLMIVGRAP